MKDNKERLFEVFGSVNNLNMNGEKPMSEGIPEVTDDTLIEKLQAAIDLQDWNLVREVMRDVQIRNSKQY